MIFFNVFFITIFVLVHLFFIIYLSLLYFLTKRYWQLFINNVFSLLIYRIFLSNRTIFCYHAAITLSRWSCDKMFTDHSHKFTGEQRSTTYRRWYIFAYKDPNCIYFINHVNRIFFHRIGIIYQVIMRDVCVNYFYLKSVFLSVLGKCGLISPKQRS